MDGKQLKNSILQWAIQGKLVPQNPKDEPAQKLLERIAAARNEYSAVSACHPERSAKGTKSKDLKKKTSKNPPSRIYRENGVWYEQVGTATPKDISDEIPFEIPENWALCRIKDICSKITDGTHHSPVNTPSGDYKYVTAKNIKDFGIQLSNISYVDKKIHEEIYARCNPNLGDILYIKDGATTGVCCINDLDEPFSLLSSVALLKPQKEIFAPYLLYCLRAPICYDSVRESMKGTGITRITLTKIEKWIIPLPPLAEQKRIVAKLEQVLPLAEEYGAAQEQLDKLNKELPEALKKSILQEAIQGKLVPQNPKDEPAQILLERIAASRNGDVSPWSEAIGSSKNSKKSLSTSLRGAKATKQSKNPPSRIYRENDVWYEQIGTASPKDISDEIPFEIPETWAWCRLKDVVYNHGQKTPTESFSYIDIGSIDNKHQKLNDKENIIQASDAPSRARKIVKIDDILYSTVRPYLHNMCIIDREFSKEPIASTGFAVLACNECVVVKFLFYYLLSPKFDDYANDVDNAKGIAYPAINDEKLYKALIPIPPLAEQKRIVAKLEQLFKVL